MASYDLRCTSCGQDFEIYVQGFLKDADKLCPACGSRKVEQRFTGFLQTKASTSSGGGGHSCAPSGGFG